MAASTDTSACEDTAAFEFSAIGSSLNNEFLPPPPFENSNPESLLWPSAEDGMGTFGNVPASSEQGFADQATNLATSMDISACEDTAAFGVLAIGSSLNNEFLPPPPFGNRNPEYLLWPSAGDGMGTFGNVLAIHEHAFEAAQPPQPHMRFSAFNHSTHADSTWSRMDSSEMLNDVEFNDISKVLPCMDEALDLMQVDPVAGGIACANVNNVSVSMDIRPQSVEVMKSFKVRSFEEFELDLGISKQPARAQTATKEMMLGTYREGRVRKRAKMNDEQRDDYKVVRGMRACFLCKLSRTKV